MVVSRVEWHVYEKWPSNTMKSDSITRWIDGLKAGDEEAARKLWDRYVQRLIAAARKRLGAAPCRVADEEDVVIDVFDTLCRGAAQGHFPKLTDREDLWKLLLVLTRQKAVDQIRRNVRQKRGGGKVRGDSIFGDETLAGGFDQFLAADPTPEFLTMLAEEHERLLAKLRNDTLRQVALGRMAGESNDEIAGELNISTRAVERKFQLIRKKWSADLKEMEI